MPKKIFTPSQVKEITGASDHEPVCIPFYYAPPYLDKLREWLESNLASSGGRPTLKEHEIVRKIRFTKEIWTILEMIAKKWSEKEGISVGPALVAASIIENTIAAKASSSFVTPSEHAEKAKPAKCRKAKTRKEG